ncbi:MAG: transposase [Deltaproteobacteria bacterium]|nr:transposase [Deltaproteobacteria bacterium]
MARPLRITYSGAYYHITSRGNEQRDIFKSQKDREKFLYYLDSAKERYGAAIHAYCLMSNHFHLLLETPRGNLSEIMRHIVGAYTTYFNIKRKRAGHLFQGRYKSILIEGDEYATELSRYIHLNPVRAGIVALPEEYKWSSYQSYIGQVQSPIWLKTDFVLGYFGKTGAAARKKYREFIEDLVGKEYESALKDAVGASILGSADFIKEITATHLKDREEDKNIPALRHFEERPMLSEICMSVKKTIDGNDKLARQASIYLSHRYSGERLRDIAELFDIGETAICEASKRFSMKMKDDKLLRDKVDTIMGSLKK